MALSTKRLAGPTAVTGGTETIIFTATVRTWIDRVLVSNLDSKARAWTMSVLASGQTAANAANGNRLAKTVPIAQRDVVPARLGVPLEIGESLSVLTPTGATMNFTVIGSTGLA